MEDYSDEYETGVQQSEISVNLCLSVSQRLDGRGIYDSRGISVNFGHDRGHVEVAVGDTR